ncbi:sugar-binding transcriptional regulator [Wukongibacter sp. M2B1]|uniref:sugar-binding transcriptional regulator n=1 Tax=Wukongibacter sp. M2B1 TaxID=3088895 RepID=UPI003D7A1DB5
MNYEDNLLFKVAWFYYMENMTQQKISQQLNISRMKVVKYLEQARNQGIVQFKIKSDGEKRINIEQTLMHKFGLKHAYVIPTVDSNVNESIAKAAAQYIEGHITPNSYINVGYGDTVSRTINNLTFSLNVPVSLVTLSGGVSYYTSSIAGTGKIDPTRSNPQIYFVPSPLIVSSKEMAKGIWQEKSVREIINMAKLAHMTVVGIGAVDETATIFRNNMISRNELILLKMNGAVGDILSQFYDKNGNKIEFELHNRLISTQLNLLKNMRNVIGVAGGPSKIQAILGALQGGYLDALITDEATAESLVKLANE